MNIFYLDNHTHRCAKQHCDKHVVKMIIEYAQLLSTAHRVIDGIEYTDLSKNGRKIKRWKMVKTPTWKKLFTSNGQSPECSLGQTKF